MDRKTRRQKCSSIAWLLVVSALLLSWFRKSLFLSDVPRSSDPEQFTIGLMGDVMIGHSISEIGIDGAIRQWGPRHIWGNVAPELARNDVNIFNLEMALTKHSVRDPPKAYNFRADPDLAVPALKAGNMHVAVLANNHVRDYGEVGLNDTISALSKAGLQYVGAGGNLEEAMSPLLLHVKGRTIAIVAVLDVDIFINEDTARATFRATANRPGVFGVEHTCILQPQSECGRLFRQQIQEGISKTRNADVRVFFMHLGRDCMGTHLSPSYRVFAREVLDEMGFDIFVGTHPHHFQALEPHNGKLIIASPGQFVDDFQRFEVCPLQNKLGLLYRIHISCRQGKCGISKAEMLPVAINHAEYRVDKAQRENLAETMNRQRHSILATGPHVLSQHPQKLVYYNGASRQTIKIMVMGDSITQSCCCSDMSDRCCDADVTTLLPVNGTCCRAGYRQTLWKLLDSSWRTELGRRDDDTFAFVGNVHGNYPCSSTRTGVSLSLPTEQDYGASHEGYWGFTSAQLVDRAKQALPHLAPDLLLLCVGVNDIIHRPLQKDETLTLEAGMKNLRAIIELALLNNEDSAVIVSELFPCIRQPYVKRIVMCKHPELIEAWNRRLVLEVQFLRHKWQNRIYHMSSVGFNPSLHTYDGLHPNAEGESVIAHKFYEVLRRNVLHVNTEWSLKRGRPKKDRPGYIETGMRTITNTSSHPFPAFDVLQARSCASVFEQGAWVAGAVPPGRIGSLSAYKDCFAYQGGIKESKEGCIETVWKPSREENTCLYPFHHFSRADIERLVSSKWIAFIGDSTLRLVYSSIIHALRGGLPDSLTDADPTHDFRYDEHSKLLDKCRQGHCHREEHVADAGGLLTFDMVTNLAGMTARIPSFLFDGTSARKAQRPDMVILNNGPWEVYLQNSGVIDSPHNYHKIMWQFMRELTTVYSGPVIWLGNTFRGPGSEFNASSRWAITVEQGHWALGIHKQQQKITDLFSHVTISRESLQRDLPSGYTLKDAEFNPFHLPGIITDESANILMSVIAAGLNFRF